MGFTSGLHMTDKRSKKRRPVERATITKRRVDALRPGESLVDDQVRGFAWLGVRRPCRPRLNHFLSFDGCRPAASVTD